MSTKVSRVGTIFSDTAAQLKPQYLGTKNGPVRQAVENVVREVEAGSLSADDGWQKANKAAEKAAVAPPPKKR